MPCYLTEKSVVVYSFVASGFQEQMVRLVETEEKLKKPFFLIHVYNVGINKRQQAAWAQKIDVFMGATVLSRYLVRAQVRRPMLLVLPCESKTHSKLTTEFRNKLLIHWAKCFFERRLLINNIFNRRTRFILNIFKPSKSAGRR